KELAARKAAQDSVNKANAIARAQFVQDSIASARVEQARIAKELADKKALEAEQNRIAALAREKAKQDSIAVVKAEQARVAKELAARKAAEDSVKKAATMVRAKFVQDSMATERAELAARLAASEKAKQEAVAVSKAEQERVAREFEARRAAIDSVNRAAAIARAKVINDSIARSRETAAQRLERELAQKRVLELREAAQQQATLDSLAAIATANRMAKELAQQQLREAQGKQNIATTQPAPPAEGFARDNNPAFETSQPDFGRMPAILFDKNSGVIAESSKAALKVLAQTLMKNPAMSVNIYAFASADESDARQVSLQRSDAVLRYLIINGVELDQVKSFYHGTTISRNGCANPNCPEGLLQQNRAVAYQLVQ
ncbi:MAG TPA: OmpA family protein, partial [Chitinophagales bacterium]|nr:OmpA family protein [Chitinophagales bacterium]